MFRIDKVGQEEQVLGLCYTVTFATFGNFLLLHSQQVSYEGILLGLKFDLLGKLK